MGDEQLLPARPASVGCRRRLNQRRRGCSALRVQWVVCVPVWGYAAAASCLLIKWIEFSTSTCLVLSCISTFVSHVHIGVSANKHTCFRSGKDKSFPELLDSVVVVGTTSNCNCSHWYHHYIREGSDASKDNCIWESRWRTRRNKFIISRHD